MVKILIIDDDEMFCDLLSAALARDDYEIVSAYTLEDGLGLTLKEPFDIVFLDVNLPDGNGLEKLTEIRNTASIPEVIILTGSGSSDGAELAIKSGAWDYIQKPSSISVMMLPLMRALQYREEKLKKKPPVALKMGGIIGNSSRMKACYDLLYEASSSDANVLITGETGTGKELFAKAIHENSRRAGHSFVVVDCAALQENLTESTLFGYEKGAFTSADQRREGLIKQADGGTLFLDEIGELPLPIQKGFLRVIQERRFRPLGSVKEIESDFRLIVATNRKLDQMVASAQFREDFLFRIRSITIELPPLRDHTEDIVEIALYHVTRICQRIGMDVKKLSPDFLEALFSYQWPGNVRELVNAIERAIAASLSGPTLFQKHLPSLIRVKLAQSGAAGVSIKQNQSGIDEPNHLPKLKDLREATYVKVEKKYLENLMKATEGNIEKACLISDLSRTRLYELLRKHRLSTLT
jgi:two-component system, NtrC family, response regulator